ncbi:MAG: HPr-rel-A system PqqD family peptide chaperone [Alphaproteobacteria bacterium]|nr:HPr-rel-A system PqqD family peptide chaperone [Alphaproteobacteria bacterium]
MNLGTRLGDLAISDSGFVFDPYTGASFTVNATGLHLLRALKDGVIDRAGLLAGLDEAFDVDGADAGRDVDDFLGQLRRYELLPRDFELGASEVTP